MGGVGGVVVRGKVGSECSPETFRFGLRSEQMGE